MNAGLRIRAIDASIGAGAGAQSAPHPPGWWAWVGVVVGRAAPCSVVIGWGWDTVTPWRPWPTLTRETSERGMRIVTAACLGFAASVGRK